MRHRLSLSTYACAFVFILAWLPPASPARAATIPVTNTLDTGAGSLRRAVLNAAPGDTVVFDSAVFSQPLTITLTGGQIEISRSLSIDGAAGGAVNPTLNGNGASRIFQVDAGAAVTLTRLVLTNGSTYSYGAAIKNGGTLSLLQSAFIGNTSNYGKGGAVYNDAGATLNLVECILAGNNAPWGYGGGLFNTGTASVLSTTFAGNTAFYQGGAIYNDRALSITSTTFFSSSATEGGAIMNTGSETPLRVVNTTFASNHAAAYGGGISNHGWLTVTNSTFWGNSGGEGGALAILGSTVLRNTIIAGSPGGNCWFGAISGDHNLEDADSCGLGTYTVTGSLTNTNPLLAPLQINPPGQPLLTLALLPGSPAIDAGNPAACPATDERGWPRAGARCDIGAFEYTGRLWAAFVPLVLR